MNCVALVHRDKQLRQLCPRDPALLLWARSLHEWADRVYEQLQAALVAMGFAPSPTVAKILTWLTSVRWWELGVQMEAFKE